MDYTSFWNTWVKWNHVATWVNLLILSWICFKNLKSTNWYLKQLLNLIKSYLETTGCASLYTTNVHFHRLHLSLVGWIQNLSDSNTVQSKLNFVRTIAVTALWESCLPFLWKFYCINLLRCTTTILLKCSSNRPR